MTLAPIAPLAKSGAEGDRTPDLLNAIQARSQLRHSPNFSIVLHSKANDINRFP